MLNSQMAKYFVVWELFRQNRRILIFCFYHRGFEKFDDPCPISRERNIWQMVLLKCLFLMISGTIWYARPYLTLFSNSHILNAHRGGHFEKTSSMEKLIGFGNKHPDFYFVDVLMSGTIKGRFRKTEMATNSTRAQVQHNSFYQQIQHTF